MRKIIDVNVEHNGQSWFGTPIPRSLNDEEALAHALAVLKGEMLTGHVTRVEFTYEGDEDA
jgi:hypothetical protein